MSFIKDIFGGGDAPKIEYTPAGFNAGGLNASFGGNTYSVNPTAARTGAVGGLSDTFATLGNELGGLRSTVAPGYNQLLDARLNQVNDAGTAAIGNLRENLAARRILGSSFGMDTLQRAQNEVSRQRDQVIADNFLRSLDANQQLLTQQYGAYTKQYQTALDELNLEANVAQNLTGQASQQLAANARAQAELESKAQQQAGQFWGNLFNRGLSAVMAPSTGGASLFSSFGGGGGGYQPNYVGSNGIYGPGF